MFSGLAEIEFQFDISTATPDIIEVVEVSCPTELTNLAYRRMKESGALSVTFGQAIDREEFARDPRKIR